MTTQLTTEHHSPSQLCSSALNAGTRLCLLTGSVLLWLVLAQAPLKGAALEGTLSRLPAGANVRLSSEGSLDWVQWGLTGPEDVNRKAGITPLIGATKGQYRVYLRAATTGDGRVIQLDRVTNDPTQPNQRTEPIGTFPLLRSRLLLSLRTIPLTGTNGSVGPVITLNGTQTLRLTALDPAGGISVNYLVFVPEKGSAPASLLLSDAKVSGGSFSFSFATEANTTYAVESRAALSGSGTAGWQRVDTIVGDGSKKSFTRPASTATGFYRVLVP